MFFASLFSIVHVMSDLHYYLYFLSLRICNRYYIVYNIFIALSKHYS